MTSVGSQRHSKTKKNIRQTEIQTAEPLMPEPSAFEVEMVIY